MHVDCTHLNHPRINTMSTINTIRPAKPDYVRSIVRSLRSMADLLFRLIRRYRSRQDLLELTDEQLRDIGISRADADYEGTRGFFDPMARGPVWRRR